MSAIPFVRRVANERVDGTLTVKIDIEPMYKLQFLQMFPEIGTSGALVRLTNEAAPAPPQEEKEKPGELCIMACNFCEEKEFRRWLCRHFNCDVETADEAKEFIYETCHISSRKELDSNAAAAEIFHREIRAPFVAWKSGR